MRTLRIIGQTTGSADAGDAPSVQKPASGKVGEHDPSPDEAAHTPLPREIGGRDGPDPTRYGDWEKNGRCIDF